MQCRAHSSNYVVGLGCENCSRLFADVTRDEKLNDRGKLDEGKESMGVDGRRAKKHLRCVHARAEAACSQMSEAKKCDVWADEIKHTSPRRLFLQSSSYDQT